MGSNAFQLPVCRHKKPATPWRASFYLIAAKSVFFYLTKLQFNRSGSAKDQYSNFDTTFVVINFLNNAIEVRKRPFNDANDFPRLKQSFRLGLVSTTFKAA